MFEVDHNVYLTTYSNDCLLSHMTNTSHCNSIIIIDLLTGCQSQAVCGEEEEEVMDRKRIGQ